MTNLKTGWLPLHTAVGGSLPQARTTKETGAQKRPQNRSNWRQVITGQASVMALGSSQRPKRPQPPGLYVPCHPWLEVVLQCLLISHRRTKMAPDILSTRPARLLPFPWYLRLSLPVSSSLPTACCLPPGFLLPTAQLTCRLWLPSAHRKQSRLLRSHLRPCPAPLPSSQSGPSSLRPIPGGTLL